MRSLDARARAAGLAVVVALLGAAPIARADEISAAESFRAGTAAYARGEYRAAALAFEAAFRERPHGNALYNAGQSWAAAGALPRAADAYEAALKAGGLDEKQETDARAHLRDLERSLGAVMVTAPAGALISLEHQERVSAPVRVHVTPGEHAARADLTNGQAITKTARVGAGEQVTLSFEAPEKAAPPVTTGSSVGAPVTTGSPVGAPAPKPSVPAPVAGPPRAGVSGVRVLGWGLLGGSAVAGGVAIYLGVRALDARDEFNASKHTSRPAHDRAASLRTGTNVTWAAAGALGVAGVVIVLATPGRPKAQATLHVSPGGAAIAGSF